MMANKSKKMKILVLTWEFPPRIVGGIARHVAELYPEVVKLGHEVHLVTMEFGIAPAFEVVEGVQVYRVTVAPGESFFHWIGHMNESMGDYGGKLLLEQGPFDVIHAHDWLVGDGAIALQQHFQVPLVATIHATEYGRNNGIHTDTNIYIHNKEQLLAQKADRVIVCSNYMIAEVVTALEIESDKTNVIFNGIRPGKKKLDADLDRVEFRRRFARDEEKIVYYVGRMSHEKGVQVLLDAAPQVLQKMGDKIKFTIIGGGNTDNLKERAWNLGIWEKCYFTGFMSDEDLDKFQTIADCAVFPSLYEPFGIVALENFAAKVPVVVANVGGLPEVVQHGKTGIVTIAGNADSLALGIVQVLQNPDYARFLVDNAFGDLASRFSWEKLAEQTEAVYRLII